jgi:hypothetical protein
VLSRPQHAQSTLVKVALASQLPPVQAKEECRKPAIALVQMTYNAATPGRPKLPHKPQSLLPAQLTADKAGHAFLQVHVLVRGGSLRQVTAQVQQTSNAVINHLRRQMHLLLALLAARLIVERVVLVYPRVHAQVKDSNPNQTIAQVRPISSVITSSHRPLRPQPPAQQAARLTVERVVLVYPRVHAQVKDFNPNQAIAQVRPISSAVTSPLRPQPPVQQAARLIAERMVLVYP